MNFYNRIRPFITRGNVLNEESIHNNKFVVQQIIRREQAKYSNLLIMKEFYHSLYNLMSLASSKKNITTVMDVGCGSGQNLAKLALDWPKISFVGIDIVEKLITDATRNYHGIKNLLFMNKNFLPLDSSSSPDLIMCLETLEHIEDIWLQNFIEKLFEMAQKAIILSVPREPLWCLANLMRFKYWSRLGNTPSHLQHWSKKGFEKRVLEIATRKWGETPEMISHSPFKLWTMVLLIKHNFPHESL